MRPGEQVEIERLSLRVHGMDPLDARALARAVAERLADGLALGPGEATLARLNVEVRARPDEPTSELAARTSEQVTRQINTVNR